MIAITDQDIRFAQSHLLKTGEIFDVDRVNFIKSFKTLDLHASPGCGKTTALLAKLLILNRHTPFSDGSGILILSHTNAAVDEIKNKIGQHCSKLLAYPNFIGTIQSFIDSFLAGPYYSIRFGTKIHRIDDSIYDEEMGKLIKYCLKNEKMSTLKNILRIQHAIPGYLNSYRFGVDSTGKSLLLDDINGSELNIKKPKGNTKDANYIDFSAQEKADIARYLIKLKKELFKRGTLCFDDPYYLAEKYLFSYPKIQEFLCHRFKMVFVDEMQDMALHQIKILDAIFYNGTIKSIFQRIGDKNQAIYNSKFPKTDPWNSLGRTLVTINGSQRFNQEIADKVKPFGENYINIQGSASRPNIRPTIILYDDISINKVLLEFAISVKSHITANNLTLSSKDHIKAIGWRKNTPQGSSILSYFPEYDYSGDKLKSEHSNLFSTILILVQSEYKELGPIRKIVLNSIIKFLKLERVSINNSEYFTTNEFLKDLNSRIEESYLKFLEILYDICIKIYSGDINYTYDKLKKLIVHTFEGYSPGKGISSSGSQYLEDKNGTEISVGVPRQYKNIYKCPQTGININIETIHSVKGQTHWATLYLETFYQGKHESDRLKEQLTGVPFNKNGVYDKHATRMMYVGLSRPTELLAFACHINRIRDKLPQLQKFWIINENLLKVG